MEIKTTLGWILIALGVLFLISGLFVTNFAIETVSDDMSIDMPPLALSVRKAIANRVMDFTIQLLVVG